MNSNRWARYIRGEELTEFELIQMAREMKRWAEKLDAECKKLVEPEPEFEIQPDGTARKL